MKKLILAMIALFAVLVSTQVYAAKSPIDEDKYKDGYYDPSSGLTIGAVYRPGPDGKLYKVPIEQWIKEQEVEKRTLAKIKEEIQSAKKSEEEPQLLDNKSDSLVISPMYIETWWNYNEGTNTRISGLRSKMSADVDCRNQSTACSITISQSVTTGTEFSSNVGSSESGAIIAGVSYTWQNSSTSGIEYGLTVDPGKRGYAAFTPWLRYSSGYNVQWGTWGFGSPEEIGREFSWAKYPVRLPSGAADGTWLVVYW